MEQFASTCLRHKISPFLIISFFSLIALKAAGQTLDTIIWQGDPRRFDVFLPNAYDPAQKYPIVISLHPGASNSVNHADGSKWHELGKTEGFITVYPNGRQNNPNSNARLWNAYDQSAGMQAVDDKGFLNAMLDTLIARYGVDTCRVYLSGFSNGAMMLFRMACEYTNRFAAYAPLSGGWGYGTDGFCGDGNCDGDPASPACDWNMANVNCQPMRKPPLIFMKGSLEGDNLPTCRATIDSLQKIYWSTFLNCAGWQSDTFLAAGKTLVRERFTDCNAGAEYQFLTVIGNGHLWHQPATALFWDFFKTKSLCSPASSFNENMPLPAFQIFPNPTDGILTIEYEASKNTEFILVNSIGQVVKRGHFQHTLEKLNLQGLPPGGYFFIILDGNQVFRQKIVFQQ